MLKTVIFLNNICDIFLIKGLMRWPSSLFSSVWAQKYDCSAWKDILQKQLQTNFFNWT